METAASSQTRRRLNPAEPARGRRLFLFLSLSLNIGLVVFLAFVWRTPEVVQGIAPQSNLTQTKPDTRRAVARHHPTSAWSQLESADPAVYASHLRDAGCPPKTIRDIVLPLIEDMFAHAELPPAEPTNVWSSFSERRAVATARAEQESAVRGEKDQTTEEVLGFAWDLAELKQAYAGEAAGALGFLDYDRAEKLLCIADRFSKQFSREENLRRIDRRESIYQQWRAAIGEVLSAAEFEETELRGLLMINQRRNPTWCNAGLSGSELRQLMMYRRELCNPLPSALLADGRELVHEVDSAGEQQFHGKARSLLGDNRFIDFLKSSDASVERTLFALETEHLPRTMVLQLFDLRQDATTRARQIRELPVHRAEKRVQLAALRQSAIEQIAGLANVPADSPLLRYNMDWLQEIKNP